MTALLNKKSLALCLLSAVGWICIPLVFQTYLDHIISRRPLHDSLVYSLGLLALIIAVFVVEFRRFTSFLRHKPAYSAGQSLPAKLSQDRLWAVDVPNLLSHSLIAAGGITVLSFRDPHLSLLVVIWFAGSYYVQAALSRRVRTTAQEFHGSREEHRSLSLQEELLKKQVIAGGLGTVLRIAGQVVIYSLLFLRLGMDNRDSLAAALANIEYVALILASLQVVFSSLPKISELRAYLA